MWDKLPKRNDDDLEERLRAIQEHMDGDVPPILEEDDGPLLVVLYRQADSIIMVDRLYKELADEFTEEPLVREGDIPPLGEDDYIPMWEDLAEGDGLLVVIGPTWLSLTDEDGTRRIDKPDDPVRKALEVAFELGLRVVPILVYEARLPKPDYLPEGLKKLGTLRPLRLGSKDEFDINIDRDLERIKVEVRKVLH